MVVGSAATCPTSGQQDETASLLKQLEKEQRAVDLQLKQLKANWKNTDANQRLKHKLQSKLKELSDQIQQLQTQGVQKPQETTEAKGAEAAERQRFDVYEKSPEKAPTDFSGIYKIAENEEGHLQMQIDAPKQNKPQKPNSSVFFERNLNYSNLR